MKHNRIIIMATICCAIAMASAQERTPTLVSIYLPREIKISVEQMTIGSFAVVRSQDEALAARVSAVPMGRAPWSDDQVFIDRQTVLSRLASEGFTTEHIQLIGAAEVVISRDEVTVSPVQLVDAAGRFLSDNPMDTERLRLKLIQTPQELVVPAGGALTFQADWADTAPDGHVAVRITILSDGRDVGQRTLLYRMVHLVRKVVTTRQLEPGDTISPQNTKVVVEESNRPQAEDWSPPYGTEARTRLAVGVEVRTGVISDEAAPVVIKRNTVVVLKIEGVGFLLTCHGTALQDGRAGDLIRVRNVDSKRVITAKVLEDGSVEPVISTVILEVSR